ncbi:MAG TPA: alpha/beta hydrolase [Solirubrobacteraceae bacterium]|nr:alpha/beta hydrolase [Solirubrobacteraceae bacterium]
MSAEIAGLRTVWLQADSDATPTLYVHGVPSAGFEWREFLRRGGGLAPDLPGFGRSAKDDSFDVSIAGYGTFIEAFVDALELERINLVVHDWGAVALAFAQRRPERIERLVLVDAVPLLPGYAWHRTAKIWRTPLLGELSMAATTPTVTRLLTRESNVTPGPLPESWLQEALSTLDSGTQRAILRLYRSAPPDALAAAGEHLAAIGAPALVIWGERDPYLPPRFARDYAAVLGAELELLDAGHWPWLDRPEVIDRVVAFVNGAPAAGEIPPRAAAEHID